MSTDHTPDRSLESLSHTELVGLCWQMRDAILADHKHKPDDRCGAYTDRSGPMPPGPPCPPIWCARHAGHDGPHRTMYGGGVPEPIVFRASSPGWCSKCNVRWPCDVARVALASSGVSDEQRIEAAAQWLIGDDTAYAAEPDFARRAARHMLKAAGALLSETPHA